MLRTDLGVTLPLHISLSRPLTLQTEQKENYLAALRISIGETLVPAFNVKIRDLIWHPNEDFTRWFLVLRLEQLKRGELDHMLNVCNKTAAQFGQTLLYSKRGPRKGQESIEDHEPGNFHISIAWSLNAPPKAKVQSETTSRAISPIGIPAHMLEALCELKIDFAEIKVRIGQDVTPIRLKEKRSTLKS